ncbi:MAG: hypothetical protein MJD61_00205 [Proteobacteria bacterium]|nr:hypothetical protein [Pseudomonadota bacterium]
MKCKSCGESVEELVVVRVEGRRRKVCEDCAEQLAEQDDIAEEATNAMRGMMEYKG